MADGRRVLVSGLSARITRNRARSVHSELCEHRFRVSCLIQLWNSAWIFSWAWLTAGGSWFWDPECASRTIVRKACAASFASTVTVFPALYSCENWHEHSVGQGRWLEGLGFRICSRTAHNRTRSVRSELCEHRYHVSCFIQLWNLAWIFSGALLSAGGSWFWDPVCASRAIARKACAASFASTVTVFPASYSCENWHEYSVGQGWRLEGLGFRICSRIWSTFWLLSG